MPVVEYNFYAHRAIEGYYETVGRARSVIPGFDYELELPDRSADRSGARLIYRDENGRIGAETLAAFPDAKKVKFKDLPALEAEGKPTTSMRCMLT